MGWAQASDPVTEEWVKPARVIRVKKQIWDTESQEFVEHYFGRVSCKSTMEFNKEVAWMLEQFGAPMVQGKWWHTADRHLWLSDSLITFWLLKHPD